MPSTASRRLKVAPHFKSLHPRPAVTSSLRLQGDWLEAAGFAPGTVAVVQVENGRLIITPAA